MNNKLIFLGLIPVLMLTVPNVYASEDNCDENPNDSLCNGDRGIEGLIFCDVLYDALYHIPYTTLDIYLPLVNVYATPYRLKYLVLGQGLAVLVILRYTHWVTRRMNFSIFGRCYNTTNFRSTMCLSFTAFFLVRISK